jgi:hypothetical protein
MQINGAGVYFQRYFRTLCDAGLNGDCFKEPGHMPWLQQRWRTAAEIYRSERLLLATMKLQFP